MKFQLGTFLQVEVTLSLFPHLLFFSKKQQQQTFLPFMANVCRRRCRRRRRRRRRHLRPRQCFKVYQGECSSSSSDFLQPCGKIYVHLYHIGERGAWTLTLRLFLGWVLVRCDRFLYSNKEYHS